MANEETFYIIEGEGILFTPDGQVKVKAGDLLFFPANPSGAHKLMNSSTTNNLKYLDVDTNNSLDFAIYPNTNKIGVFGQNTKMVFNIEDEVDYYEGE